MGFGRDKDRVAVDDRMRGCEAYSCVRQTRGIMMKGYSICVCVGEYVLVNMCCGVVLADMWWGEKRGRLANSEWRRSSVEWSGTVDCGSLDQVSEGGPGSSASNLRCWG